MITWSTRLNHPFLNLDFDREVNQWLALSIISALFFAIMLYWLFVTAAPAVADNIVIVDGETIRSAARHIREHNLDTPFPLNPQERLSQ